MTEILLKGASTFHKEMYTLEKEDTVHWEVSHNFLKSNLCLCGGTFSFAFNMLRSKAVHEDSISLKTIFIDLLVFSGDPFN